MNDGELDLRARIVIVGADLTERALIAAELQEEEQCRIESTESIQDALAFLILRASLVVMDWSGLDFPSRDWPRLQAGARGAPILVLAGSVDRAQIEQLGIPPTRVLFRPLTVGQVVARARELLLEGEGDDG